MHDQQIVLRAARVGWGNPNLERERREPVDSIVSQQFARITVLGILASRSPILNEIDVRVAFDDGKVAFPRDANHFVWPGANDTEVSRDGDEIEWPVTIDVVEYCLEREIESMDIGHDRNTHTKSRSSADFGYPVCLPAPHFLKQRLPARKT